MTSETVNGFQCLRTNKIIFQRFIPQHLTVSYLHLVEDVFLVDDDVCIRLCLVRKIRHLHIISPSPSDNVMIAPRDLG